MRKRKRGIVLLVACVIILCNLTGCTSFDAEGYTQAVLDLVFQGETKEIKAFLSDYSEKQLEDSYKENIVSFAAGLTEGLQASEGMQDQFHKLCADIFRSVRYNVVSSKKVDRSTYEVVVEMEPTDVFRKWKNYLEENSMEMKEKWDNGYYEGTEEEKTNQMLLDMTAQSCELLDTAMLDAVYGEKEEMTLTVQKNAEKEFRLLEEDLHRFTEKILGLDAITE